MNYVKALLVVVFFAPLYVLAQNNLLDEIRVESYGLASVSSGVVYPGDTSRLAMISIQDYLDDIKSFSRILFSLGGIVAPSDIRGTDSRIRGLFRNDVENFQKNKGDVHLEYITKEMVGDDVYWGFSFCIHYFDSELTSRGFLLVDWSSVVECGVASIVEYSPSSLAKALFWERTCFENLEPLASKNAHIGYLNERFVSMRANKKLVKTCH